MRINWEIGPRARKRLAEMAEAGLTIQTIYMLPDEVYVEIRGDVPCPARGFFCCGGNTVGQAVGKAYAEWKGTL